MSDLNIEGMALAEGVVETIIAIALKDVEGVASVGAPSTTSGLLSAIQQKPSTQGIEVQATEAGTISVSVRVEVYFGQVLPELANRIRVAVADAVNTQVGINVSNVDVFIDGIRFE
ncbi:MAG: Asp23/Gls24 family envelope stress response protein [Eggerthellaceae bacterium]|jgi:uncharacterized alkaline shock family protein YloU|uniref:Uncharacterized conserved protein YloU, alkaline shock protein (Asp23) family n=1 Tax=Denitrobacterium detoxificans TaxID=79604 RepID=A0A172RXE3_9ACTN|nr:Asp23/Gls24 family envelope stress response protein [Denitrobacterium detoxificans]ANE22382.1 alkaline-shock protein [Denitrobacterium detoxificans]MBE6465436.1 Asp23/Gls24 family envelope stress response protein [Denitrobacterium detoxificans]MCR5583577.1 Asp23/Gls24 family envelope stress response protein [Eggerthellaceae bacterium]SEO93726.1 Uncharacterized conserved protein YloU, alkaline shock protein (Asp23) family [Denitrobacterium detoxificans]